MSARSCSSRCSRATLASPVTASMRRRLEPIDDSLTTLIGADVAGGAHVGAAAQLDRRSRLEHPHDVAVLVAEERDGAERFGLVLGGLERARRRVGERLGVGEALDLGDLVVGDRLVVAEVEAQPVGPHQRAGLLDVVAEHLAQRGMQQVGGGVVAPDGVAPVDVDRRVAPSAPGVIVPSTIRATWRRRPGSANVVSSTSAVPVSVVMVPVSPTWPPLSA